MVEDTLRKEFDILDPETETIIKITMSLQDYLKYRQMRDLITAIRGIRRNG
jgi:hypothetical protein